MKNKQTQSGSIHLLAVILIVIALIGTLGFVYWQNFMQPATKTVSSSLKTISINPSTTEPIYFTYPATWTVERETTENIGSDITISKGSDIIKIYSPTKKIYVDLHYNVRGGGFGYECGADYGPYLLYQQTTIPGYIGYSYFEEKVQNSAGKYFFGAYINPTLTQENLLKHKSEQFCYVPIIYTRVEPSSEGYSDGVYSIFEAQIRNADFYTKSGDFLNSDAIDDISVIDDLFNSSDFQAAKQILLSARSTE